MDDMQKHSTCMRSAVTRDRNLRLLVAINKGMLSGRNKRAML